jgi:spore maturation protein CgeB
MVVRIVIFCHSLVSDWNHGNAHFIRGVVSELLARDHDVRVLEPAESWSRANLIADCGADAIAAFHRAYPQLRSETYSIDTLDLDETLEGADLVIVHEWTDPGLVERIGRTQARRREGVLLFHDSHHRSVTDPAAMSAYNLAHYDGVLAFGDPVRDRYLANGWTARAWTWHEAADTRVFYPRSASTASSTAVPAVVDDAVRGDLVWIGNWGDEERTAELDEFLFTPVKRLGLHAVVFGVRYPDAARARLATDGIEYRGWLPNHLVPEVFSRFAVTVHVPRRPYLQALPGIPTIRPFEALACGIPLVSARWDQTGGLFTPGSDFLVARDGDEMTRQLSRVLSDEPLRQWLTTHGLQTIRTRHTCAQRVDELMATYREVIGAMVLS